MSRYEEHSGSFVAKDKDGNEYRIHIYTTYEESMTRSGTTKLEGPKRLATDDGANVNRVKRGHYTILGVLADIAVTSDDPGAP